MRRRRLSKIPMDLTSVRVAATQKAALVDAAKREGISQSELLRLAVQRLLEGKEVSGNNNPKPPSVQRLNA
jgi:hypothetical protein